MNIYTKQATNNFFFFEIKSNIILDGWVFNSDVNLAWIYNSLFFYADDDDDWTHDRCDWLY